MLQLFSFFLLVAWFLPGCAKYHPMPLPESSQIQAPQTLDMAKLRIPASEIKHPLLRPVMLDPEEGLSPEAAGVLAVLLNPSLRAVRDQRAVADAQLLKAGLLPNPELAYSFEVPTGGDTAGTVTAFGLELNWDVVSLITHSARTREASAQRAAVEMETAWQEWQVAEAAKSAVYQVASLEKQIGLAEEIRQGLAENATLVQKAVAAGTRTEKDLTAAQSASLQADAVLLDLKKQAQQYRLQLNQLLGLSPDAHVRLREGLELPSRFEVPLAEELFEGLEQRRLDLLALRLGYDSQEEAVRIAVLEQFPRISIGPAVGRDVENVDTAGFGLSVSLPIFDRSQGKIAIERATRQRLFNEYANRVLQARSNIQMVSSRIDFLNRQIAAAQAGQSTLEKLADDYRAALADGRIDVLSYFGAWRELADSRMNALVLKGQLAEAVVALELEAGMYQLPNTVKVPASHNEVTP